MIIIIIITVFAKIPFTGMCYQKKEKKYTHLNAEFQKIARRDKNDFFSNQCKDIEENNRMKKTSYLFKKIRITKGTFHKRWAQ